MSYKTINFIIDKFTGYNISQGVINALEFDFLSRDEIYQYQQQKFQELSQIASQSEYYKNFCNKPLKDFPLIDRVEYQANIERMKTNYNHPYHIGESSGSTGHPVNQYVTKDMLQAKRVSHQKMLRWYGLNRESPEFKLGGLKCSFKTNVYHYLRNKRYFDSYTITEMTLKKITRLYNRFKPKVLYGYPSAINKFLMFAKSHNIKLFHPAIVVTHAENLYKEFENNYRNFFPDSKIVNQYWSTEANIAETCPDGSLHIDEDTVICEIINADENGYGDLYITNLFSYIVPIIRYKIGDRVKISDKTCSCGRNTKIIDSIEGREYEYLELRDGDRFPLTAIDVKDFIENIGYYQLVYYKNDKKILFKYKPIKNEIPIKKEIIISYMKDKFGLYTEFEQVSDTELSPGGKLKRLIVID